MRDILQQRVEFLMKASNNPRLQAIEIELCKKDILHFFRNHLYTDKNSNLFTSDEPQVIPFIPFPFQEEAITEIWNSIITGTKPIAERDDLTNVFIEKSRQMWMSWVVVGIFVYWLLFHNHKYLMISQKEIDVDKRWDMKSLFEKARFMIRNLPKWMIPEINDKYMSISRLDGTWSITGESANPNAGTGGTYHAVFMDEMAKMANWHSINNSCSAATPCRIFNSTPYGEGNEYYRMRKLTMSYLDDNGNVRPPEIKGLRYHWSEHPKYDKAWYEWKTKGMTPEKIAQELEIDYNTAIEGRVYNDFPKDAETFIYDYSLPIYVFIDHSHGWSDPNAVIVCQRDGVRYNIIDSLEVHRPPEHCAMILACKPTFWLTDKEAKFMERWKAYDHKRAMYIWDPYDTKSAMWSSTILNDYRKHGIELLIPQTRDKEEQIQKTRTNIYRVRYNNYCLDFASAILNARYPTATESSNITNARTKPVHDRTSHYRTALEYGITWFEENPIAQKARVVKDKRSKRNYVTGELM